MKNGENKDIELNPALRSLGGLIRSKSSAPKLTHDHKSMFKTFSNANLEATSLGEVVEEPELSPQELRKLNDKVVRESERGSCARSSLKNSDDQQNFGLSIKLMASVTPSIYEEKVRALGATPHRKRSAKNRSSVDSPKMD